MLVGRRRCRARVAAAAREEFAEAGRHAARRRLSARATLAVIHVEQGGEVAGGEVCGDRLLAATRRRKLAVLVRMHAVTLRRNSEQRRFPWPRRAVICVRRRRAPDRLTRGRAQVEAPAHAFGRVPHGTRRGRLAPPLSRRPLGGGAAPAAPWTVCSQRARAPVPFRTLL
eukprot:2324091-Prymnesium_polylepis.1